MKAIKCEMCGSSDLVKQDGVFVCQSCGLKYSTEEIKKLMIEGTVDVSGSTVKIDDTEKIENYYTLAQNAYDSNNKSEAENYCNKIIEVEPTNYKAWFLKGKAAGWQSTVLKPRMKETVFCFSKAIENAPEAEVEAMKELSASEISSLSIAVMNLCCNHFAQNPSDSNKEDVLDILNSLKVCSELLVNNCGVEATEFYKQVASTMHSAVNRAYANVISKEYQKAEHPSKYDWEKFRDRCIAYIVILEEAVNLSDDDSQADVQRYKDLITVTTNLVNSCSYKPSENNYNTYVEDWHLSTESRKYYNNKIKEYDGKLKKISPEYATAQLKKEIADLKKEIADLGSKLSALESRKNSRAPLIVKGIGIALVCFFGFFFFSILGNYTWTWHLDGAFWGIASSLWAPGILLWVMGNKMKRNRTDVSVNNNIAAMQKLIREKSNELHALENGNGKRGK